MVAGWLEDKKVNEEILVLVGQQGIYKTRWFEHLLPPQLNAYFKSTPTFGKMDKDEMLSLSQFGLICLDEIDGLKADAMSRLKWAVTTKATDDRKPYAHNSERRIHIASYCGTSNNLQFIDDDTGTRRWLTFEVESIRSPMEYPIHHDEIFAQAYALYLRGFRYWFEGKEIDIVQQHNKRFEVAKPEQELVSKYYRVPAKGEACVFVSNSEIMQTIGGLLINRLTPNKLGRVMNSMGFVSQRSRGERGYNVVAYTGADIELNRTLMAQEAKPESEVSVISSETILDAFDTLF
jgi:predicted P-loop ATPase